MAVKDYIAELAQKAGLDASLTETLLKATENPTFAKELEGGVMRQSDYSRALDGLRSQEAALKDNQAKWMKYHADNEGYVKELEAKVSGRSSDIVAGPSKAELDTRFKETVDRAVGTNVNIMKQALKVQDDYRTRFGKSLDLDALEKLALETNLPLTAAYDQMIKPELEAKAKADTEKAIADAKAEGAREALSKHNLPVDNAPADASPFFQPKTNEAPLSEGQRARNFADSWSSNAGQ